MNKERPNYLGIAERKREETCSVRVILLDERGNFPLVRYENTPWLGLPGGRVEIKEYPAEGNLLSKAAFPTLVREINEECGLDLGPYLSRSACLGATEVSSVKGRQIKHSLVSIFLCLVPGSVISDLKEGVVLANINDHLPGPIFPDARMAIQYLKESRGKKSGPIEPEFLTPEKPIWVTMAPKIGLLFGPP